MCSQINGVKRMKQLSKLSILLLLAALVFCACDKNDSDDNGGCIYPNPSPSMSVANFTGEVKIAVDAPLMKEQIEQDLMANPPFGGSKMYQLVTKKQTVGLAATIELYALNPEDEKKADGYILDYAGDVEKKDSYSSFLTGAGISGNWYKMNVVPTATEDGKPVATYDVFVKQNIPGSMVGSKMYFCEDLTEKYRQKFPDADIHAVARCLVLSYVKGGDVVKD